MIPVCTQNVEPRTWQSSLQDAIVDVKTLLDRLCLSEDSLPNYILKAPDFKLKVPEPFIEKMAIGDPYDPLLLQVLPLNEERNKVVGFTEDPVKEQQTHTKEPGLIHKYPGRVLFITSPNCAINCRYCFRRSFPYENNRPGKKGFSALIEKLKQDDSIYEVILSGGDPLTLPNEYLAWLLKELETIRHLKLIRFHTRLPIVIPERIENRLVEILSSCRKSIVMVLHSNHPNELDDVLKAKMKWLKANHISLLNQSVLLKNINDDADTLAKLSFKLFEHDIMPYYLHALDKVAGAHHFLVKDDTMHSLYQELTTKLPGYLTPKLVREIPGELSKTVLFATQS